MKATRLQLPVTLLLACAGILAPASGADLPVIDLLVEDPPIEEVIERVFAQGNA